MVISLHVDDLIVIGSNNILIEEVDKDMIEVFEMIDLEKFFSFYEWKSDKPMRFLATKMSL